MTARSRIGLTYLVAILSIPIAGLVAQTLRDGEVRTLATAARTPDAHGKLAARYRAHAAEHEADAKLHDDISDTLRKARPADDEAWDLARDAAHYAEHSREAAEALRDLAAAHDGIRDRLLKK